MGAGAGARAQGRFASLLVQARNDNDFRMWTCKEVADNLVRLPTLIEEMVGEIRTVSFKPAYHQDQSIRAETESVRDVGTQDKVSSLGNVQERAWVTPKREGQKSPPAQAEGNVEDIGLTVFEQAYQEPGQAPTVSPLP
ncbi:hypothetical protein NDU88_004321 [Pleurodeles waltl]|uniref:Uncharacterized protein n=1 Tax=Pleurodeles waltl TaxID=8319 RepID=A0AAV7NN70_PLEWA|nr:hypothetical protein NDU88_004321 [Pleurodeles waltl]